jgi:hypothetical protein
MKKVVKLTESDLMRIVERVINEEKDNYSNINEYYGVDGSVDVKIEGHGQIREVVLDILRKSLRGLNGDVNLYFGDEKVRLRKKDMFGDNNDM